MPIDLDPILICPHCGRSFVPPLPNLPTLSPLAMSILTARAADAAYWRRGKALSLRRWALLVYADPMAVRRALLELVRAGYAVRLPYGRTRWQYAGVPGMTIPVERALAA